MKTRIIAALTAIGASIVLPSCMTVVDPIPTATTEATTTTTTSESNPYTGGTTHKKTTTTTQY